MPWVNLTIIIVAVYLIYKLFGSSKFANKLTDFLRARIVKKDIIKRVTFEELAVSTGGYGISQVEVCKDSSILGKSLFDSDLRRYDITILAIEREGVTIPNPSANTKLLLGDRLICFGKLENIRKQLCLMP
jgi:K+/H+ antiporter YhaU regulatory subunit KhtT